MQQKDILVTFTTILGVSTGGCHQNDSLMTAAAVRAGVLTDQQRQVVHPVALAAEGREVRRQAVVGLGPSDPSCHFYWHPLSIPVEATAEGGVGVAERHGPVPVDEAVILLHPPLPLVCVSI